MNIPDGIAERLTRSWELVKISGGVLMQDKELLLFPVVSAIAGVLLFTGLVIPGALAMKWTVVTTPGSWHAHADGGGLMLGGAMLWYFSTAFVATFMNAALVACVRKRLAGGDPTIGYGLAEAGKRTGPILGWSLLTTSVGILLRFMALAVRKRGGVLGLIGQILIGLIGFAWTIGTMFVVPVMIVEGTGVFGSFKRSIELLRRTWGEQLVMNTSIGLVFTYLHGAVIGLVAVAALVLRSVTSIPMWPVIAAGCVAVTLLFVVQATLTGIFNTVLYGFATGETIPDEFAEIAPQFLTTPLGSGLNAA